MMIKTTLIYIAHNIIPAILLFISKNQFLFKKLETWNIVDQADISWYQTITFFVGIIWAGIINSVLYIRIKINLEKKDSKFKSIIKLFKKNHFELLKNKLDLDDYFFNTRVFVLSKSIKSSLKRILFKEYNLVLKDIPPISDEFDFPKLSFKVTPNQAEGMVGKSFKEKIMFIDFDLDTQNQYILNEQQKIQVRNTKFCSTIPIFGDNQKILGVISIDSEKILQLSRHQIEVWKEDFVSYAAFIDKHFEL